MKTCGNMIPDGMCPGPVRLGKCRYCGVLHGWRYKILGR